MARAPKPTNDANSVQVRLEVVKSLMAVPGFAEFDLPTQFSIIDSLVNYVLTGKK